jgi:hypothetical protein
MAIVATPYAAHAVIPAPSAPPRVGAPARAEVFAAVPAAPSALGAVWPDRLAAPWPLPDTGLATGGRSARLFTEGAVAVVRGVTAAEVAAGLRYLAARIEQGAEAVVRVDEGFACEAERVAPVFAPRAAAPARRVA